MVASILFEVAVLWRNLLRGQLGLALDRYFSWPAVKKRGWSAPTRNRALAQLSGLFSYAYGRRWIDSHPTERGRVPRLAERNAQARWLRMEEVAAIVAASPFWLAVIIKFAVSTGMRLGEITSLTCASYRM